MRLSPLDPLSRVFTTGTALAHFYLGRYDEAIDWSDRTLAGEPRYRMATLMKAVCYAHLGRGADARDWLRRTLELEPDFTIARLRTSLSHLSPEHLDRWVDGLRKAGLREE